MRSRGIELAGIRIRQPAYVARKLDASRLHPQTNSKVGNLLLPRIPNRNQHPLNPTFTKSPRHKNPVVLRELILAGLISSLESLGLNPVQIQFQIVRQSPMHQRLLQRLIAVFVFDVLAYYADCDLGFWVVDAVD